MLPLRRLLEPVYIRTHFKTLNDTPKNVVTYFETMISNRRNSIWNILETIKIITKEAFQNTTPNLTFGVNE